MNRKFSKIMGLLMTLIMVGSGFTAFTHVVGATTGSRDTEPANDNPPGDVMTSGVVYQGSLMVTNAQDYYDWYQISCTRGQVLNMSLYLIDYDNADHGKYNINFVLYGPANADLTAYNVEWWSSLQTRWDAGSALCTFSGPNYIELVVNSSGGNPATLPTHYKISATTSTPPSLTGSQSDQKTLTQTGPNWFQWYKIATTEDQSFQVKVTPPANEVINLDMYGIWNRGIDKSAGNESLQPWFLNQTGSTQVGTPLQMTGMTGDMDIYVRLALAKENAGAPSTYKFDVTNILIPSDNDNTPAHATVIPETRSILNHIQQSMDHMDWYKFTIDSTYTADIMFNTEGSKISYWNMTLWDSTLNYINGSFDTVSGNPYIKPDPQNHIVGNPTTGSIALMKWKPSATGTYYISIAGITGDPDHITDLPTQTSPGPLDQNYRLYVQLPNWGPQNKSKISDADINEDQIFKINVSTYFKDPEGDPLSFTGRVDNANVGFKIDQKTGNVTVTPKFNWAGICNVSVDATDGMANIGANTITQTFKLNVHEVDDPPYVVQDMAFVNFTMSEAQKDIQTYPYQLTRVFADIDGAMTYSWSGGNHVKVREDLKTTNVFFSADDHWFGVENITFLAKYKDTAPAKDTVKVTVKHMNHGPTLHGDQSVYTVNMDEGAAPNQKLKASDMFNDLDVGDPLYVTGDVLNFTVGLPEPPYLNVTILKDNTINIALKDPYWSGDDHFTIVCTDKSGATNQTKVNVVVKHINQPPIITDFTPKKDVVMNDGLSQLFSITVFDRDNDTRYDERYSWFVDNDPQSGENVKNSQFTFRTVLPPATGFVSGSYVIKVEVTDGIATTEHEWNVTVNKVNQAPKGARIVSPVASKQYEDGKAITFQSDKNASDPDSDTLYYTWYTYDASKKVVVLSQKDNFVFDWKDKTQSKALGVGLHTIYLSITDNKGGYSNTSMTLTVKAKSKPASAIPGFEAPVLMAGVMVALVVLGRRKFKHV